jgi:hypothetical protein
MRCGREPLRRAVGAAPGSASVALVAGGRLPLGRFLAPLLRFFAPLPPIPLARRAPADAGVAEATT